MHYIFLRSPQKCVHRRGGVNGLEQSDLLLYTLGPRFTGCVQDNKNRRSPLNFIDRPIGMQISLKSALTNIIRSNMAV